MENSDYYYQLDRLNGRKVVVMGNHDLPKHSRKILEYVENVAGMIDYKDFALTHAPIHPSEISFYRGNIHAHIHHLNKLEEVSVPENYGDYSKESKPTLHKYFCADAWLLKFRPILLEEVIEAMK